MTTNAETPRRVSGAFQEDSAAGGSSAATVAHDAAPRNPDANVSLIARPVPVQTSGRTEFAARCPRCKAWHRHVHLGVKSAPCGATYRLEFAGKEAA